MAYLARNHRNNETSNRTNSNNQNNTIKHNQPIYTPPSNSLVKKTNGYLANDYRNKNQYGEENNELAKSLAVKMQRAKEKQKKEQARKAISQAVGAFNPIAGAATDAALKTPKGQKYLDAYSKADNPQEGIRNVKVEMEKERRIRMLILMILGIVAPILFIILIFTTLFKNADSQIFSNINGGTVESDSYEYDEKEMNIFKNYPGLYEKVERITKEVSDKYSLEVDKFLVLATLIAPIENDLITPVDDGTCGEDECYMFKEQSLTWTEFLDSWGDQAELLSKMQMLTYVPPGSEYAKDLKCGEEETMEQYAKNDLEINEFPWYGWLNPANWFKGFRSAADAELNAKCTEAPSGKYKVPVVRVLSTERGEYYHTNYENGEYVYEMDPKTGGVYFWNLVNQSGFLHEYLKDYLSEEKSDDPEENYKINLNKIIEIANDIYDYYETIKKTCGKNKIIESTIENITVENKDGSVESIPFEDQYIGGVLLAEYHSGSEESLKAFAILARSFAISKVGTDGSGTIENSSNDQNYNAGYSKEKYPNIAKAVEETKGMVVSDYRKAEVYQTEYDAFCPIKNTLENGFYYLPDEQQNLPINVDEYSKRTGRSFISSDSRYLNCPCFQNQKSRPHDLLYGGTSIRYSPSIDRVPNWPGGTPSQATKEICWEFEFESVDSETGETEYGFSYTPSGGHGRGASQYGIGYFGVFDYEQDAIIRLFYPKANIRLLENAVDKEKCEVTSLYEGEDNYLQDDHG